MQQNQIRAPKKVACWYLFYTGKSCTENWPRRSQIRRK